MLGHNCCVGGEAHFLRLVPSLGCQKQVGEWKNQPGESQGCRGISKKEGMMGPPAVVRYGPFFYSSQPTLRRRCDFFCDIPQVKLIGSLLNRIRYKIIDYLF